MSNELLLAAIAAVAALWLLLTARGRAATRPAIQGEHLAIESIADGVVTFTDGRRRAALEVGSVNFAALGEARQRELVAGYAAVVDSLAHPIQILVRTVPHDLTPYLAGREGRAAREPNARLRRLSRERNAFVRRLAGSRTFVDRRFYLVVPADEPRPAARIWPGRSAGGAGSSYRSPDGSNRYDLPSNAKVAAPSSAKARRSSASFAASTGFPAAFASASASLA